MNSLGFKDRRLPDPGQPVIAMSVEEACRAVRCGATFLRQAIRDGRLRAYRVGPRRLFILPGDLRAFIETGDVPGAIRIDDDPLS